MNKTILTLLISFIFFKASAQQPEMVTDLKTGTEGSYPQTFVSFKGKLYFFSKTGNSNSTMSMYVSDGTAAGTQLVSSLNSDAYNVSDAWVIGNKFYFMSYTGTNYIYESDGTDAGTKRIPFINNKLAIILGPSGNSLILYNAGGVGFNYYSWNGGTDDPKLLFSTKAAPSYFGNINNKLYFLMAGFGNTHGIYTADANSTSPQLIKKIYLPKGPSTQSPYAFHNNKIYFAADDSVHGNELWITDGTESGTHMIKDVNPGKTDAITSSFASGNTGLITVLNDKIIFKATTPSEGREFWITDGTENGTSLIKDLTPSGNTSDYSNLVAVGNKAYFAGINDFLYVTDGTSAGTKSVFANNTGDVPFFNGSAGTFSYELGGKYVFAGYLKSNMEKGVEIWQSDGTESGTTMFNEINTKPYAASMQTDPSSHIKIGNTLYFVGEDADHGRELWKLTMQGTVGFKDISKTSLLSVYPNPANEKVFINTNAVKGNFCIYDQQGKLFYSENVTGNSKAEINVSSWAEGMYLYNFTSEDGNVQSGKIIVE